MSGSGRIVSLEGISGTGKTYLINRLKERAMNHDVCFVPEVSKRLSGGIDHAIVGILAKDGDRFFRSKCTITQTFLLLAVKVHDYEARVAPVVASGGVVVEDRSIDTVAIYQGVLLERGDPIATAHALYELAAEWRRPPDRTILLEDDFDSALGRAQAREGRKYTDADIELLRAADENYRAYATHYPSRIVRLDRRSMSEEALLECAEQVIHGAPG